MHVFCYTNVFISVGYLPKSGKKGYPLQLFLCNIVLHVLDNALRQEKEMKAIRIGKRKKRITIQR